MDTTPNKTMIVFTDGSAHQNTGPTGTVVIIKKNKFEVVSNKNSKGNEMHGF